MTQSLVAHAHPVAISAAQQARLGVLPRGHAFKESWATRLRRIGLAAAYLMLPKRIGDLPALTAAVVRSWAAGGVGEPTAADIQTRPAGFAGIIAGATPQSLLAAHRLGFFPQAHCGPLKWWTREQRFVQMLSGPSPLTRRLMLSFRRVLRLALVGRV
jgi:leucyl/phenylalanyl-tRNA---protein transferase